MMNPRRKKRLIAITVIFLMVAAAVGLMLFAMGQNINLFYTPSQILQGKDGHLPHIGERLSIGGMVVPGSVQRDEKTLQVTFQLTDTGPVVTVEYQGLLPDLFREGQGIVAKGILISPDRVKADEVLAKHDEKYMPPEMAQAIKKIKHVKPSQGVK